MNTTTEIIRCKYCQSVDIIKFGIYEGVQRYYCKDCQRKFTLLDTLLKMQTSIAQISSAVAMYYEGLSLNEISRMLKQIYNLKLQAKRLGIPYKGKPTGRPRKQQTDTQSLRVIREDK